MVQISYTVTIGSTTYKPENSRLLQVKVNASMHIPINHCVIILSAPDLNLSPGVVMTVDLGYDGTTTRVFTGKVGPIAWGMDSVVITGESAMRGLTGCYLNRLFEKSSAGEIVKSITKTCAGFKVDRVESGLSFPGYSLGDRTSAWEHLETLSQQCGFDLYVNVQDQLVFAKYAAKTVHMGTYGKNILDWTFSQQPATIEGVQVYGESPASQQGEQAYAWLTKAEVKGTSGKLSVQTLNRIDPTARTPDLANKIAAARLAQSPRLKSGKIKLLGLPEAKLGDGIKLSELPIAAQNGTFKITAVTHHLSAQSGFYTNLEWEEI